MNMPGKVMDFLFKSSPLTPIFVFVLPLHKLLWEKSIPLPTDPVDIGVLVLSIVVACDFFCCVNKVARLTPAASPGSGAKELKKKLSAPQFIVVCCITLSSATLRMLHETIEARYCPVPLSSTSQGSTRRTLTFLCCAAHCLVGSLQ